MKNRIRIICFHILTKSTVFSLKHGNVIWNHPAFGIMSADRLGVEVKHITWTESWNGTLKVADSIVLYKSGIFTFLSWIELPSPPPTTQRPWSGGRFRHSRTACKARAKTLQYNITITSSQLYYLMYKTRGYYCNR